MKVYHLDPSKLTEQKRNVYLTHGITLVLLLALNFFLYRGTEMTSRNYLMFALIVVMFVFVGWSAIRQRTTLWNQYELMVDESGIKQKQPKAADSFLPREELTDIKESKYGMTLYIKGGQPVMGIPKLLTAEDYEEIKATVFGWLKELKPTVVDAEAVDLDDEEDEPAAESAEATTVVDETEPPAPPAGAES